MKFNTEISEMKEHEALVAASYEDHKANNFIEPAVCILRDDKSTLEEEHSFREEDEKKSKDPFQEIMAHAGNHGRFQLIYNLILIMGLATAGAMIYMNIILALNIPEHWCNVPGQDKTNLSLNEWRTLTLPKEKDNRGTEKFSSCKMYDANFTHVDDWTAWNSSTRSTTNATECQNGWSYDLTWYERTIPTEENWVCSRDLFVTNVFVVSRVVEVVGSFVLGQMGDILGRRPVFYISVVLCAVGRMMSILTTDTYIWFLIFTGFTAFGVNSIFQAPQIVGMEISREKDRSLIAIYQSFGWSFGTTFMPLFFWWIRDWRWFMWITTIPTVGIFFFAKYVIESPRWLISKRRFADAVKQFQKIARINGRNFDMSADQLADMYGNVPPDPTFGMASLFNGWRLARNTCIMGFSWCVVAVSYFTLVLFSSQMGGNPFLNFLLQSIVEIPAYILGKYLGDKYGRRFTNCVSFFISFVACIPVIIYSPDPDSVDLMTGLATFIKFLNALTFFTASLQGMEIYPTCMRQTGYAFGTILANAIGIVSPYLVYLGTTVDIRMPYYILGSLFLVGAIAASFLPETLHKKLPDTLEEARNFGIHDKFFSLPKPVAEEQEEPMEEKSNAQDAKDQKLNQVKYAP